MSDNEVKSENDNTISVRRERRHVLALLSFALVVSFFSELFIAYGVSPLNALTHFQLYKSTFNGVVVLAVIPFLLAYALGRLLCFLSYLLKDDKRHPTQYFLAWLLSLFFAYYLVMMALDKRDDIKAMTAECIAQVPVKLHSSQQSDIKRLRSRCMDKVIGLYAKVRHCRVVPDKERNQCVYKILYEGGFFSVSSRA